MSADGNNTLSRTVEVCSLSTSGLFSPGSDNATVRFRVSWGAGCARFCHKGVLIGHYSAMREAALFADDYCYPASLGAWGARTVFESAVAPSASTTRTRYQSPPGKRPLMPLSTNRKGSSLI